MPDPLAAIGAVKGAPQQTAEPAAQKQEPKRSFESVLKQTENEGGGSVVKAEPSGKTSGSQIEQLRLDLMERTKTLASDKKTLSQMLPYLSDGASRRGLLQEAMQGIRSPVLGGSDFKSILGEIENRWLNVERIMTSDQTLSNGELLGLQARLYQVAQHVEVVSKWLTGHQRGKTILNTNI
jgi:hypothetical protein